MALARVQATGKGTGALGTVALTFPAPPTVGNGIIVAVAFWWVIGPSVPTCTDNRSNSYSTALSYAAGTNGIALFYCPLVATTGSPFTITLAGAGGGTSLVAAALEVSGVGSTGLGVDGSASATQVNTTPATGNTGTLTVNDIVAVALHLILTNQASITVASVSPAWTEEAENLTALAGEIDSRVLTSASGTTTSASWTDASGSTWRAGIVAFKATGTTAVERTEGYVWGPV